VRKIFILAIALMLVFVTACQSNQSNQSSQSNENGQNNQQNAESTVSPDENVTVKDPLGKLPEYIEVKLAKSTGSGAPKNLPEGETLTSNKVLDLAEETFGVKLNYVWTAQDDAYDQKLKLDIASNNLPDLFMVRNYSDYLDLVKNDMIEDLAVVFEDYASDRLKEIYQTDNGKGLEQMTIGGKLYGLSGLSTLDNTAQEVWLRKDWLDKHQLSEPKTLDDLRQIVKVFNEKEGTTGIPGTGMIDGNIHSLDSFDSIFQVNHSSPGLWIKGEDGKIVYGSVQPETKKALEKLREMYQEGTIDKEFATSKVDMVTQKVAGGKAAAYLGPWWAGWSPIGDSFNNDSSARWRAYLLQDDQGKTFGRQDNPVGLIAVAKKGFKYPELLVKLLNLQVDRETNPYKDLAPAPATQTQPLPIQLFPTDSVIQNHTTLMRMVGGEVITTSDYFEPNRLNTLKRLADAVNLGEENMGDMYGEGISRTFGYESFMTAKDYQRVYSEYYGTTPTMSKRWVNLKKIESEAFLQIVLGKKPIDYFDDFVNEWNAQGGMDITKEINEG